MGEEDMDFFTVADSRRSIRKYVDRPVEPDKIARLVETALRAPTARGRRSTDFVVIEDRTLLKRLAAARPSGGAFVAEAPLAIAVCTDPEKANPWIEDAAIAATHLQLAAVALGLGSCWFHIRDKEQSEGVSSHQYVAGLLGLEVRLQVECIVAIGYPAEEKPPYSRDELPFDRVRYLR